LPAAAAAAVKEAACALHCVYHAHIRGAAQSIVGATTHLSDSHACLLLPF
jgi:hypothetical protein